MQGPPSNLGKSKTPEQRGNTLRLDQRTLTALMDKLDSVRGVHPGSRRRYARLPYRHADVRVLLTHPGGSTSELTLCSRDISSGGMSLLHSAYVHKGSGCRVVLQKPCGGRVTISGKVVRCEQLAGLIHEVGIAFSTRVSLREIFAPDPTEEFFSLERVDPAELKGRLLHVDNANMGRRLLQAFLNESNLAIHQAGTIAQGVEAAKQQFDVIVAEYSLPDGNACDLIEALTLKQVNIPVMILLSEMSMEIRENLRRVRPAGVLRKPVSQDRLQRVRAAETHVGVRAARTATRPEPGGDRPPGVRVHARTSGVSPATR